MTFNVANILTIDDLLVFSDLIKKGIIQMPNISKLARQLGKNRRTVRNALNGKIPSKTRIRASCLDKFRTVILELLKDEFRQFEYYQHLYNYMKREHNITCSYSLFKRYVKKDDELNSYFNKKSKSNTFTERFETPPGDQIQFDLKEKVTIFDTKGNKYKTNVATLTLGYSRNNIRLSVPDITTDTVIDFLTRSFEELGGVPNKIVIDNLKCLVDKPRTKSSPAILNAKFVEFAKDYNIEVIVCMPYRPQTKGKTETQNKVPSQLTNYNGTYKDLSDVHQILEIITEEDNNKISQATSFPPSFLLPKEKEGLQPLPSKEIRAKYYLTLSEVNVSNESLVSYKSNKYSVPKEYIGKKIGRRIRNGKLHLYYNNKIVTIHEITNKKINIKPSHELYYESRVDLKATTTDKILSEMENIIYDNC